MRSPPPCSLLFPLPLTLFLMCQIRVDVFMYVCMYICILCVLVCSKQCRACTHPFRSSFIPPSNRTVTSVPVTLSHYHPQVPWCAGTCWHRLKGNVIIMRRSSRNELIVGWFVSRCQLQRR